MDTTIFQFSGTGNSVYVAKKIAEKIGDTRIINMATKPLEKPVGGDNKIVGFVFPSYHGKMSKMAEEYIKALNILEDTYCFCIVTMGIMGSGSVLYLRDILKEKGIELSYADTIIMPDNYVVEHEVGKDTEEILKKADEKLEILMNDIKDKKVVKINDADFKSTPSHTSLDEIEGHFYAEDGCIECGFCVSSCPCQSIHLKEGKPEWDEACEHCMACINWCPQKVIQYCDRTKTNGRYKNPKVKFRDVINNRIIVK